MAAKAPGRAGVVGARLAHVVVDQFVLDDLPAGDRELGMRSRRRALEEVSEALAATGPDALECGAALLGDGRRCTIGVASGSARLGARGW